MNPVVNPVVRSNLLESHGFQHAFSTRRGGVSDGAFASLNLARTVGDERDRVRENHLRFCRAVGCDADVLYEASQVHGDAVVRVDGAKSVEHVRTREADALVASGSRAVAIRTADCVPLLFADPASGAVAAVHAGWRGVVARIAESALERLARWHGAEVSRILCAIGPHIRLASFEVGREVARAITEVAHGAPVVDETHAKPHVDLAATLVAQLAALGLPKANVEDVGGCTFAEPDRFFSHRRDAGLTGRHLSAIVARV